jgi:hypothetical protein
MRKKFTEAELYDIYDKAVCAVYDAMDAEPDERLASKLEAISLMLGKEREKYSDAYMAAAGELPESKGA